VDEIVKRGFQEHAKNASDDQEQTYKVNKRLDFKAKVLLYQCISVNIFQKISQAAIAKQAWDMLKKAYGNAGKTKKVPLQSLRRQFEFLSMTDQESIFENFNKIQALVNSMLVYDEVVEDMKIVKKVVRMLTPSFYHIIVAIEESKDLGAITVEEL